MRNRRGADGEREEKRSPVLSPQRDVDLRKRRRKSLMKNDVVFALGYYSGFYPVMFWVWVGSRLDRGWIM